MKEILITRRLLTDVMRVQLDNTQSIIYIYVFVRERSSLKINYSCFETDFGEDFTRIDSFCAHISTPKLDIEDFVHISVICKATCVRSMGGGGGGGFKISA